MSFRRMVAESLAQGYSFEVFSAPDFIDIVRPDGSIAFRVYREGSPPDAYAELLELLAERQRRP